MSMTNLDNKIIQVNAMAAKFYHHILMDTPDGKAARQYLNHRKISSNIINEYQLGFAPRGSQLKKYLRKRGVSNRLMLKAGLLSSNNSGAMYDKFFSRIMYPINNIHGDTIAFSGRVLNKKDSMAKYMNTPETNVFHKSNTIFNLDKAHQSISKHNRAFLMEGYMDIISAHRAGVDNAIASMGTSLTKQQIGVIKGLTNRVTVCYDGDRPGQDAINRAMKLLKGTGIQRSVVQMPEGIDPDEYRRKYGVEKFRKYMASHIESPRSFQMDYGYRKLDNKDINYAQGQRYAMKLIPEIANSKNAQEKNIGVTLLSKLTDNGKPIGLKDAKKDVNNYVIGKYQDRQFKANQSRWQAGLRYYRNAIGSIASHISRPSDDKKVSADLVKLINKYHKADLTKPLYSIGSDNKQHHDDFPSYKDAISDAFLAHKKGVRALDSKYQKRASVSYIAKGAHNRKSYNKRVNEYNVTTPKAQYNRAVSENKAIRRQYDINDKRAFADDTKQQAEYVKTHTLQGTPKKDNKMKQHKPVNKKVEAKPQEPKHADRYTMYCDGGCRNTGNQKKGGHVHSYNKSAYAYLILKNGKKFARGTRGYYGKTNNRMEIQAVIQGFYSLYRKNIIKNPIRVVSDSRYVDNSVNKHWLKGWARRGFQRKNGKLSNADQWETMDKILNYFPRTKFNWTKGHSNGKTADSRGNIYVDHLLNKTMDKLPDKGPKPSSSYKSKPKEDDKAKPSKSKKKPKPKASSSKSHLPKSALKKYKVSSSKSTKYSDKFNNDNKKHQPKKKTIHKKTPQHSQQLGLFDHTPS